MNIGSLLRSYRADRGFNQKQMAAHLGITREYYCMIERGKAFPSTRLILKICHATKIPFLGMIAGADCSEKSYTKNTMCVDCTDLEYEDRQQVKWFINRLSKK